MAEKSDDIKQLFSHLGLNPGDYHEIRSAPIANATVSEAPRRWSLLQAAQLPSAPATGPAPSPVPAAAAVVSLLPPSLLQAVSEPAPPTAEPRVADTPALLPEALSSALAPVAASDGLQSLFLSVKEPQTASIPPPPFFDADMAAQGRTQLIAPAGPSATGIAQRVSDLLAVQEDEGPGFDDAIETLHAPPPASRLGPIPAGAQPITPTVLLPPAETAPPLASGLLPAFSARPATTSMTAPAAQPAAGAESLADVFRRLAAQRTA